MNKIICLFILTCLFYLCAGLSSLSHSEETIVRVFKIGFMKVGEVETVVRPLLSSVGRVSAHKATNSLIIKDFPSHVADVENLLKELDVKPKQVRIKIRFVDEKELKNLGIEIKWRYKDTHWSVGNIMMQGNSEGIYLEATAILEKMKTKRRGTQNLLILSGRKGSIAGGWSVPYVDWFYSYSKNYGYYGSSVKFKDVKTGFAVEPRVSENNINVAIITPEISYFTDHEKGTIHFSRITTNVIVKNGESIMLGGNTTNSSSEVTRFFEGLDDTGKKENIYMLLTATIEE